MAMELSYVLITPYTLLKSRTGGIIARLLSRTDLELVGAQVLAVTRDFAEKYATLLRQEILPHDAAAAALLSSYVLENFPEHENGKRERVMLLLFKGEDACRKIGQITGSINSPSRRAAITGENIRDTFADLVFSKSNPDEVRYFEPAVFAPRDIESARGELKLLADFAASSSNVVENIIGEENGREERTLVIIKPDNWRHPSTKPGNIIDMLSRTGLRIVGCKIYQMSVGDALEFYGPVKDALRKKLAPIFGEKAKKILEGSLNFSLPEKAAESLSASVGAAYADDQFAKIVEFMSGRRPEQCPDAEKDAPGLVKSMVLIYEGHDAISKIRTVLGPTDPTKAPGGTVRREFGSDVMVNTAHASDAPESVARETKIVKIDKNCLSQIIYDFIGR